MDEVIRLAMRNLSYNALKVFLVVATRKMMSPFRLSEMFVMTHCSREEIAYAVIECMEKGFLLWSEWKDGEFVVRELDFSNIVEFHIDVPFDTFADPIITQRDEEEEEWRKSYEQEQKYKKMYDDWMKEHPEEERDNGKGE